MNVKKAAVTNAANLAVFKIDFSHALLQPFQEQNPDYSILDLKSHHCRCRYARETIKRLPQTPDAILLADIYRKSYIGALFTPFYSLPKVHNWRGYCQ
jgi:putative transposase